MREYSSLQIIIMNFNAYHTNKSKICKTIYVRST